MATRLVTQHGGEPDPNPNPLDTTGLCLLSLDGGGVRGLSSLYILKGLMTRLNLRRQSDGLARVKPCEVFDLIGGTSTGGLIAIMLGRLEMDVDACIAAYSELMKAVFKEKSSWLPISRSGKVKARFDSAKLRSAVNDVIASSGASLTDAFNDGQARGCHTFVCAIAKETAGVTRLRSYTPRDESEVPATICEAALATSAATGFFDPVSIGARQFVDGALGANNPVDEVEGEAANIWSPGVGDLKPLVKCFISIGTGHPGKKALEDNIVKLLSKSLVGIATETAETERKFVARWAKHYDEKRFFRFNVDQGLQDVGLAEYKEQGKMEAATDEYLRHQVQKFRVRDCVENLILKQNKPETSFAVLVHEHNIQASRQQLVAAAHSLSPSPTAIALPPLLVAAASPSIVLLQRQLKLTSDPNITESGPLGRNALHIAALSNQPRNFSLLLKAGVDVCARAKNGTTPLILASMVGHAEIVKIIIEEGKVDPNERDMYQNTPLHAAVVNNHTEVVKILLRHRADPWAVESNGWTPLHVAVVKRFEEMIQVLTQAMEVSNEATQWNSGAITEEMRT